MSDAEVVAANVTVAPVNGPAPGGAATAHPDDGGGGAASDATIATDSGRRRSADGWRAGLILAVLSVMPALLATGWLAASFPLAALGQFRPITVIPLALVLTAVVARLGLGLTRSVAETMRAPWWSVIATLAVAVGFAVFAGATHDENIILRRDAGSYAQIGYWLAHHPGLTYRVPAAAFGPSPGDLIFGSPAFYQRGDTLIPQFMTGWPTLLAAAHWMAAWHGIFVLPALVGGCGMLAIGGLAARLVGARWAPLAVLLTALAWPVLRVSQTTFSEPLGLLMLAGGICLLVDVVVLTARTDGRAPLTDDLRRRVRRHAFSAGLVLAAGGLVRIDFGVDLALTIPVIAWLWLTRRPAAVPFIGGALVTGSLAVADGAFVTRPYVNTNASSVMLMIALLVGLAVAAAVVVLILRRWGGSPTAFGWWRWVPTLGAAGVVALGAALVVRPYVQTDHSTTDRGVAHVTATLQADLGLAVDGSRGYAEQTLWWVSWYVGWPLLAAALTATAVLTWRVLRGHDPGWMPALLAYVGSSMLSLIRPGVTPDHPWADRRLVVEVIPAAVLLATWAVAAATRWARAAAATAATTAATTATTATPSARAASMPGRTRRALPAARSRAAALRAFPAVVSSAAVALFLIPIAMATVPVAAERTELGEVAAAATVCHALRPDDSVVVLESLWVPTIRAQCGLPVARLAHPSRAAIDRAAASIRSAGRTPVIAASAASPLHDQGLPAEKVVVLATRQDQNQLVRRPTSTQPLWIEFWLVRP